MLLIIDDMYGVSCTFDLPFKIGGGVECLKIGNSMLVRGFMAYEDVIPLSFFNPGSASDVIDILTSLPIPPEDRISIFISWSKDVGYIYNKGDLDILRSSK